jgi:hypothetical protein
VEATGDARSRFGLAVVAGTIARRAWRYLGMVVVLTAFVSTATGLVHGLAHLFTHRLRGNPTSGFRREARSRRNSSAVRSSPDD